MDGEMCGRDNEKLISGLSVKKLKKGHLSSLVSNMIYLHTV